MKHFQPRQAKPEVVRFDLLSYWMRRGGNAAIVIIITADVDTTVLIGRNAGMVVRVRCCVLSFSTTITTFFIPLLKYF
jgi:hypothetical protein